MKSAKKYVQEINDKITELHEKHGIAYKNLPSKINKKQAATMSRDALKAYREVVYSPEAYHVSIEGKSETSLAKPTAEKIRKLEKAGKINARLAELAEKTPSTALPKQIDIERIDEYSETYLKAKSKALYVKGAGDVLTLSDNTQVSRALLAEVRIMTEEGNKEKAKAKEKIDKFTQKRDIKKKIPYQMGPAKNADFNPSYVPSEEELLRKEKIDFAKKLQASERNVNRENNTDLLRTNLQKAVMRSNMPMQYRYAIANRLSTMSGRELNRLYYTTTVIDFEYIYDDDDATMKALDIIDEIGVSESDYETSNERKDLLKEYAAGLEMDKAAIRYQTPLWFDTRDLATRVKYVAEKERLRKEMKKAAKELKKLREKEAKKRAKELKKKGKK